MYYWSRWHQDFTEIAMDVMGTDALLGTEWSSETGAPQRGSTDEGDHAAAGVRAGPC